MLYKCMQLKARLSLAHLAQLLGGCHSRLSVAVSGNIVCVWLFQWLSDMSIHILTQSIIVWKVCSVTVVCYTLRYVMYSVPLPMYLISHLPWWNKHSVHSCSLDLKYVDGGNIGSDLYSLHYHSTIHCLSINILPSVYWYNADDILIFDDIDCVRNIFWWYSRR
jgi:hypothetical protein